MMKLQNKLVNIRTKRMNKPSSLYVHIPFCDAICDYFDFTKLLYNKNFVEQYIFNLKRELQEYSPFLVKTIYIGGGTPTCLPDEKFEELLEIIKPFSEDVFEYTIEANPENLTRSKLTIMKRFGVNRLSIGVQTTDDKIAKAINRNHTFKDTQKAVDYARKEGIHNINIDLIMGLPNVTKNMFLKDLERIVSLNPTHISCYSLTVHPNTVFYMNEIEEPSEEFSRILYDLADKFLLQNAYVHYEVSNWAKPGYFANHNLTYWKNEQYYAVGLGASGYIGNKRYKNISNIQKYGLNSFIESEEEVTLKDCRTYQIMTNLRTIFGLDLDLFKEKFSEDLLSSKHKEIEECIKNGLLIHEDHYLKPTYEGMMVLDQIILKLI